MRGSGDTGGKKVLTVRGMHCEGCVRAVTRAITGIAPNSVVSVDLATGRVEIESALAPSACSRALREAGYDVAGDPA